MGKTLVGLLLAATLLTFGLLAMAQDKGKEKPKVEEKVEAPDDSKLYVWGQPDKGTQSLLVIRVIDAETVEAAMLVPVTVRMAYKGDKATTEQVEELVGGKLLPFDLRGRDRFGRLTGDAYLGKEQGWLTEAAPKAKLKKDDKKSK
jgi:hypothetical protein